MTVEAIVLAVAFFPVAGYRAMLGCVLFFSAAVMLWRARGGEESYCETPISVPRYAALGSGAASSPQSTASTPISIARVVTRSRDSRDWRVA